MRCQFVKQLKEKFVSREMILIQHMINKSNMKDKFSKMNNDIQNLIFKMLHPLNIDEKDCYVSETNETIRQFWKYTFGQEHCINTRDFMNAKYLVFYHSCFKNIIKKLLFLDCKDETMVEEKMEALKEKRMSMVEFDQYCRSLMKK